jgi:ATP-dependent DNA helicase RecG
MVKHVAEAGAFSKGAVRAMPRPLAAGSPLPLLAPASTLSGVGPKLDALLKRLLATPANPEVRIVDLLWHLPNGAADRRLRAGFRDLSEGQPVTLEVRIQAHQAARRAGLPYKVRCWHPDGFVHLVFFRPRQPYLREALPTGASRVVSGALTRFGNEWQIIHPERMVAPEQHARNGTFQPLYSLTEGLSQGVLGRIVASALERLPELREWQDPAWLRRQGWPAFAEALRRIHRPDGQAEVAIDAAPRRRLAYDELLAGQLALALVRGHKAERPGRSLRGHGRLRAAVLGDLPFALTQAQRSALAEIDADMARPERMLRLLQGDVGSGKTLIAILAMLAAVEAGAQGALMAPTEILARQHASTLDRLLAPTGLRASLLTGRERGPGRARLLREIANGEIHIVVGTHALFQDDVRFGDLGLAVIDEQHRFGVHQRLELTGKGRSADLLVMTATPIPRTLILSLYGDMAVSELRTKPPGRQPIRTRAMPLGRIEAILKAVDHALAAGERLYWVCPLIAATEELDLTAAEDRYASLHARFGDRVGLVHGQMPSEQRERAITAFARGEIALLVATTVIEVGVDVPEAGVMVIEHAERFGLAQLHQLRGRVGRGNQQSSCLLLYGEPLGAAARARLKVLRSTADGFRIAEEDLRLRGPGELLGTRQSGVPAFRLADLGAHADLMAAARDDARNVLARDPRLESLRGQALRDLLRLFERSAAIAYLGSG